MDQNCCSVTVTPTDSGVKIDFSKAADGSTCCCCCQPSSEANRAQGSSCCGEPEKK